MSDGLEKRIALLEQENQALRSALAISKEGEGKLREQVASLCAQVEATSADRMDRVRGPVSRFGTSSDGTSSDGTSSDDVSKAELELLRRENEHLKASLSKTRQMLSKTVAALRQSRTELLDHTREEVEKGEDRIRQIVFGAEDRDDREYREYPRKEPRVLLKKNPVKSSTLLSVGGAKKLSISSMSAAPDSGPKGPKGPDTSVVSIALTRMSVDNNEDADSDSDAPRSSSLADLMVAEPVKSGSLNSGEEEEEELAEKPKRSGDERAAFVRAELVKSLTKSLSSPAIASTMAPLMNSDSEKVERAQAKAAAAIAGDLADLSSHLVPGADSNEEMRGRVADRLQALKLALVHRKQANLEARVAAREEASPSRDDSKVAASLIAKASLSKKVASTRKATTSMKLSRDLASMMASMDVGSMDAGSMVAASDVEGDSDRMAEAGAPASAKDSEESIRRKLMSVKPMAKTTKMDMLEQMKSRRAARKSARVAAVADYQASREKVARERGVEGHAEEARAPRHLFSGKRSVQRAVIPPPPVAPVRELHEELGSLRSALSALRGRMSAIGASGPDSGNTGAPEDSDSGSSEQGPEDSAEEGPEEAPEDDDEDENATT